MNKPNWNRLAALEFAGRLLTGRADVRAGEAQAHADWALQWLGGDLPNSERPPSGWIDRHPEGAGGPVIDHVDGDPRNTTPENLVPRNVPVEGDGSMAVPVYRFWVEDHSDWDRPYVRYWREDTRNTTNCWSMWIPANDDLGARWASQREFDDPRNRPPDLRRIATDQLIQRGIAVETRFDTEE